MVRKGKEGRSFMVQTYIVYIGTWIVCVFLAWLADRMDQKRYAWAIVALLTLVAGLRSFSVGIDTANYVEKYQLIAAGEGEYAYGLEEGFKLFCRLLAAISESGTWLLLVMAFLTNALIVLRFWDLRRVSWFPAMIFCYYGAFYFMSLNGMRQFCAVAIVFYATRFLYRKQLLPFLLGVLLACLLHKSAVLGLLFVFEELRQWRTLNQRERVLSLCCLGALPIIIAYVAVLVARYVKYFEVTQTDFGLMLPVKAMLFGVSLIFVCQMARRARCEAAPAAGLATDWTEDTTVEIPGICRAYALGLLLTFFGYIFTTHFERIGWYFYIFEGVYYGTLRRDKDRLNRVVFGLCIALLVLRAFFYSLTHDSQGTVPYRFFWQ